MKRSPLRCACQIPDPTTHSRTISTTSPPLRPERYPSRLHASTSTSRNRPHAIRMNGQYIDTSSKIRVSGCRFLHRKNPPISSSNSGPVNDRRLRSEEHTSELQSLRH